MKITINGKEIEASLIDHSAVTEPWSEYLLKDGTIIRCRLMVTRIYQVPTEEGQDPQFHYTHIVVTDVVTPEKQH
jgi:hypothetical protein